MVVRSLEEVIARSGVKFGTSGARGLVTQMSDAVCYGYATAFLKHLEGQGQIQPGTAVGLAGDLRPSTRRIMTAVGRAIADFGCPVINCGEIPSPAVALYGLQRGIPTVMVTGSHIPDDRNGIKFNTASGEITKFDEEGIRAQSFELPDAFDRDGCLTDGYELPPVTAAPYQEYVDRYLGFFPRLDGMRVGLYEHSTVARQALREILEGLGAEVTTLGRSDTFVPVDTEAIRPEDIRAAREWAADGRFDSIVSADGDGDRPLVSDEHGVWLRGDIVGILCARYVGATHVVTPVSSNTAAEKSGLFERVVRTRIGSPFVIAGMTALEDVPRVVGYEANGGVLTGSDITSDHRSLRALPTRDAALPILSVLSLGRGSGTISGLLESLPRRFTVSDRVKAFPTEASRQVLWGFGDDNMQQRARAEAVFGRAPIAVDATDGLRFVFADEDVIHLRPSGNAPEFRCYVESASLERSEALLKECMDTIEGWKMELREA